MTGARKRARGPQQKGKSELRPRGCHVPSWKMRRIPCRFLCLLPPLTIIFISFYILPSATQPQNRLDPFLGLLVSGDLLLQMRWRQQRNIHFRKPFLAQGQISKKRDPRNEMAWEIRRAPHEMNVIVHGKFDV